MGRWEIGTPTCRLRHRNRQQLRQLNDGGHSPGRRHLVPHVQKRAFGFEQYPGSLLDLARTGPQAHRDVECTGRVDPRPHLLLIKDVAREAQIGRTARHGGGQFESFHGPFRDSLGFADDPAELRELLDRFQPVVDVFQSISSLSVAFSVI